MKIDTTNKKETAKARTSEMGSEEWYDKEICRALKFLMSRIKKGIAIEDAMENVRSSYGMRVSLGVYQALQRWSARNPY